MARRQQSAATEGVVVAVRKTTSGALPIMWKEGLRSGMDYRVVDHCRHCHCVHSYCYSAAGMSHRCETLVRPTGHQVAAAPEHHAGEHEAHHCTDPLLHFLHKTSSLLQSRRSKQRLLTSVDVGCAPLLPLPFLPLQHSASARRPERP